MTSLRGCRSLHPGLLCGEIMPAIACVNGVFSAPEDARVSIEDRGYVFGDGVYETLRRYDGHLCAMDRHMSRLERSLLEVDIPVSIMPVVLQWTYETIEKSGLQNSVVYTQITRGTTPRKHYYEPGLIPNVLVTVRPIDFVPEELRLNGVPCITAEDRRWARRDIKTISVLPNILAKQEAHSVGAFEAILVEPSGRVTEGSSTNCFAVFGREVWASPTDSHILAGITREILLEIVPPTGIRMHEEIITNDRLHEADEIFITGSLTEVLGVTTLDGRPVGTGKVGPVTKQVYQTYMEFLSSHLK